MAEVNVTWEDFVALRDSLKLADDGMKELKTNLNQFFLIVMGMVVYLMQCGFAFLEAGAVRSKNSTNILIKNLMDSFVAGIAYWIIGYPLAYGTGNSFIGYSYWASYELPETDFASFFFQYVFAATAATIVSGAMAERCEFIAYFIYSFLITGFIYPVVTHWVWASDGWLVQGREYGNFTVGYQDFAGSGVVHVLGGAAAFVGALMLGPRIGRFHKDQRGPVDLRGHSVPFAALGGFILLFGFLAFNGGSALGITDADSGASVSLSVVNTIISGSMSAFISLFIHKFTGKHWSLLVTLNGALTGMVAACAGCNVFHPWGAAVLGFFAAISYKVWSTLMLKLKIDDPLDAVAVHFGGGLWGALAVAFLQKEKGIVFAWNQEAALSLAWQMTGVVAITAWTGGICFLMFGIMRLMGILRVDEELERKGLDIPKHGEPAYPMESYGHGWVEHILKVLEDGRLSEIQQEIGKSVEVVPGVVNKGYEESTPSIGYDSMEVQMMSNDGKMRMSSSDTSLNKLDKRHVHTPAAAEFNKTRYLQVPNGRFADIKTSSNDNIVTTQM